MLLTSRSVVRGLTTSARRPNKMSEAGAVTSRLTSSFPVSCVLEPGEVLENIRSAISRDLPQAVPCRPHNHRLCVVGGGPSIEDTWKDFGGYVAAINGSFNWLVAHGILPHACGLLDPREHIADLIEPRDGVRYFVSSTCHPRVFDKLKHLHVEVWHPSGTPGLEELLREKYPGSWHMVGGGTTMGVRWINLGYFLGFREFDLHGLDSSFKDGRTHAYPDKRDKEATIEVDGFKTSMNFLIQVQDFFATIDRFNQQDMDPTRFIVRGKGLLQKKWEEFRKVEPYKYWQSGMGINHVTPKNLSWPEGESFPHYVKAHVGERSILDYGCGKGRFAGYFASSRYVGYDICSIFLDEARSVYPEHRFVDNLSNIDTDVTLAHTVFLHISDDKILEVIKGIRSQTIIVCEVLGGRYRNDGNPPVFNRDLEEYIDMMKGYRLKFQTNLPYSCYNNRQLTFLEFERC